MNRRLRWGTIVGSPVVEESRVATTYSVSEFGHVYVTESDKARAESLGGDPVVDLFPDPEVGPDAVSLYSIEQIVDK